MNDKRSYAVRLPGGRVITGLDVYGACRYLSEDIAAKPTDPETLRAVTENAVVLEQCSACGKYVYNSLTEGGDIEILGFQKNDILGDPEKGAGVSHGVFSRGCQLDVENVCEMEDGDPMKEMIIEMVEEAFGNYPETCDYFLRE